MPVKRRCCRCGSATTYVPSTNIDNGRCSRCMRNMSFYVLMIYFVFSFWERHQSSGRACLFSKTTVIAQNAAALWAAVGCVAVGQGDSSHSYQGTSRHQLLNFSRSPEVTRSDKNSRRSPGVVCRPTRASRLSQQGARTFLTA